MTSFEVPYGDMERALSDISRALSWCKSKNLSKSWVEDLDEIYISLADYMAYFHAAWLGGEDVYLR